MRRHEARQHLRAMHRTLSAGWIAENSARIAKHLEQALPSLPTAAFAFTWPLPGEPDLRADAARWVAQGARASLPQTVKDQPLTFRPWTPESPMRPGLWDIPVPDTTETATPEILLIPCVGFDAAGYRLGNGGGFYDRTLAALEPRPLAIGIGWSHAALPSIDPYTHDVPMDLIVTERAAIWHHPKAPCQTLTDAGRNGI